MVQLVLHDPGLEPAGLERDGPAVGVDGGHRDAPAPLHLREDAGQGQAALLFPHRPAAGLDDRIEESLHPALAVVHDEDAVRQTDLRGGQADADLVPHGLGHVGDDLLDLRRDVPHRGRHLTQHRVAVQSHRQQGHWPRLLVSCCPADPSLLLPHRPSPGACRAGDGAPGPDGGAGRRALSPRSASARCAPAPGSRRWAGRS